MQLLHGDCLELLKEIPAGSVDMVLADPPFGTTCNDWDKKIPLEILWVGLKRVCKKNAAILLFSQMPYTADLVQSNRKMFRYEWIWQKSNKTGFLNARHMPLKEHESILVFYQKLPTYVPQMLKGKEHQRVYKSNRSSTNYNFRHTANTVKTDEYYPGDILKFPCCFHTGETQVHPTQKPVSLLGGVLKRVFTIQALIKCGNIM